MPPILIAHRGESIDAPENTLAAVNLAWQRDAEAVEVDVHLSKDEQVVVIHDSNTLRTSGVSLEVRYHTVVELKNLDVGAYKGKEWAGERIPLLSEVIATIPTTGRLIVEIKSDRSIIAPLKRVIDNTGICNEKVEFIAFNFNTISLIKKKFPNNRCLWLMNMDYYPRNRFYPYSSKRIAKRVKKHNIDGVNLWAGAVANNRFIKRLKDEGLIVYLWTINDPVLARQYIEYGADGITSDSVGGLMVDG